MEEKKSNTLESFLVSLKWVYHFIHKTIESTELI